MRSSRSVIIHFAALTADDIKELAADREFAMTVVELRYPELHLIGMPSDIEVLQRILDEGPFTESAADELIAIGTSFGDLLGRAMDMEWVRYNDEFGSDLGLRYRECSIVIFPRDMLIKRVEKGEMVDIQHLYEGVIREVQRMVDSGEYC